MDNVGTVPAAVTAYLAVHEFKPDLVISVGTAGGFKARGAAIGDVFLATAFANHDRRIPIPVGAVLAGLKQPVAELQRCYHSLFAPLQLQGFDKYGVWRIDAVPAPNLREALSLKVSFLSRVHRRYTVFL